MANYQEVRLKLTNTQLNQLNSAAKNYTRTILRLTKKNIEDEELPHELFLTARQTIKIVKLSKDQISKIIQSCGSFSLLLGNLRRKVVTNIDILLARENSPGLVSNLTSNAINKTERKKIYFIYLE